MVTATINLESREHVELWIEEHQVGRRNLSDDQKAMLWDSIRERRSALEKKKRGENAIQARWDNKKKKSEDLLVGDVLRQVSETKQPRPKSDNRAAVAKEAKLSEWQLRTAQEVKTKAPELAQQVRSKGPKHPP